MIREREQLELVLFPGVPWDGKSPRGLTRVGLGLIFNARALEKHERSFVDPKQLELWPATIKVPVRAPSISAATLLDLPF